MAAKKKRTKRGKTTVERKYEVRTEIANFMLAKAPRAALSLFRSRTGRHVRVAALAGATAHQVRSPNHSRSPALTLQIYRRNEKFGTLEIGRGSLRWWSAHSPTEHRVGWARFARMMDERAYRKK